MISILVLGVNAATLLSLLMGAVMIGLSLIKAACIAIILLVEGSSLNDDGLNEQLKFVLLGIATAIIGAAFLASIWVLAVIYTVVMFLIIAAQSYNLTRLQFGKVTAIGYVRTLAKEAWNKQMFDTKN